MIGAARPPVARALFVATILVGSFLLFLVQPMVARMALPQLGGAPNVWNSAMIVYQVLLLGGYAYAHRLSQAPIRKQFKFHLALLAFFAVTLPVTLYRLPPALPGWEVLWVPLLLLLTVGPVFFIVSAQAPLMQRWFTAHPDAGEPWALYAASNLGSLAGLLAYPLVAEPMLSIERQSVAWALGYGILFVLVATCAWFRWSGAPAQVPSPVPLENEERERIAPARILHWLTLSAIPSGLMLSTTTHLTTDIFAMPLLWVIPLGLYLLSFVVAFADKRSLAWAFTIFAPATMLFAGGLAMVSQHSGTMTLALSSVLLLFVVSVALHARLYELRPHWSRLTLFYFVMSAGGALGGAFTAIAAPVLFDWVWEHPILVFGAAMLMPLPREMDWTRLPGLESGMKRLALAVVLFVTVLVAWRLYDVAKSAEPGMERIYLTAGAVALGLVLTPWRWLFMAFLALLMLVQGGYSTIEAQLDNTRTRSYFGVYTVRDNQVTQQRLLVHGTTLHGQQSLDPAHERDVMTYYGPGSGVAIALAAIPEIYGASARVGVVGLGAGTLACLRQDRQDWTFFEIDPVVRDFSTTGTFTYLENCAPHASVIIGDARLALDKVPKQSFDILVIDAFSSDAIPLHLLTEEAIRVYLKALAPDGILIVHISNRYIELEPVLAASVERLGLHALLRFDNPRDRSVLTPSEWVVLSFREDRLKAVAETRPDAPWRKLQEPASRPWKDDHASILPYIRWNKLLGNL